MYQNRQQGQADAGFACRRNQCTRHRRRIRVRGPVRRVVQIVEFADVGVTGLQHLDIELGCNRLQLVQARSSPRGGVHRLAPAPETVVLAAAMLGKACHCALERVRVQVRDARQRPAKLARMLGRGDWSGKQAIGAATELRIVRPTSGQPCMLGAQAHQGRIHRGSVAAARAGRQRSYDALHEFHHFELRLRWRRVGTGCLSMLGWLRWLATAAMD